MTIGMFDRPNDQENPDFKVKYILIIFFEILYFIIIYYKLLIKYYYKYVYICI